MAALRFVVCTNRSPAAVAACLQALGSQGVGRGALLVTSGLAPELVAQHARAVGAALPGMQVLAERAPGLSLARNRALAACNPDDILAFIDDDAIIGSDWVTSLSEAWAQAREQVACIGGPIRARFDAGRPRWLSDALLPGLTVLDYGCRPLELDPHVRTLYGANVSFRCGPLREVGGFDERYGHAGTRVGFSEEDQAERALHRAGYVIRYVPEVWVWHVIRPERLTRRALINRRFRYGVALGRRRARPLRLAARQCVSSAIGAPLAALRGDERVAVERAVRAAENAGVMLAPLIDGR